MHLRMRISILEFLHHLKILSFLIILIPNEKFELEVCEFLV